MTQFKEKSEGQDFVSAGLFNYPVLMAGDILLYQTDLVPIGDDQRQHLELTRDVAERFNQRFGETFTIPEGVYPDVGARIKNLQEPERLMSTTRGAPQGVVRMIDPPDVIRQQVQDGGHRLGQRGPPRARGRSRASRTCSRSCPSRPARRSRTLEARYDGGGYGQFKEDVAEAVVALIEPIQARYSELRADESELPRAARASAPRRRARPPRRRSSAMYERMGFVRP